MARFPTRYHQLYFENQNKFHEELYRLVQRKVRQVARRYPPSINDGGAPWDEHTFAELEQEVYVTRLLSERDSQIDYILNTAETEHVFESLVTLQIRRVLDNRAARHTSDKDIERLIRRIRALVKDGHFSSRRVLRETYYASAGTVLPEPVQVTESDIVSAANLVRNIRIIWVKPDAERESMIYDQKNLILVVKAMLSAIKCISESDIRRILKIVLTSFITRNLSIDEDTENTQMTDQADILVIDIDVRLAKFVNSLDADELKVLIGKGQGIADISIAEELKLARPTISDMKKKIFESIGQILGQLSAADSPEPVMRRTLELASARLNEIEDSQ
jgi:hypothetical protein